MKLQQYRQTNRAEDPHRLALLFGNSTPKNLNVTVFYMTMFILVCYVSTSPMADSEFRIRIRNYTW